MPETKLKSLKQRPEIEKHSNIRNKNKIQFSQKLNQNGKYWVA